MQRVKICHFKGTHLGFYIRVWAETSLGPLIPYLAIDKTILGRSLIYHIFKRLESQPFKQRLKHKRRNIF